MATLVVKNQAQLVLWKEELVGQLSDGMWENTNPQNHWKPWCNCKVVVGEETGRDFYAHKCNYNFSSPELLSVVGARMMVAVRLAKKYGVGSVSTLAYLFDGESYVGAPKYAGEYWDKLRTRLETIVVELETTLEEIKDTGENTDLYSSKQLKADLDSLKRIVRVRIVEPKEAAPINTDPGMDILLEKPSDPKPTEDLTTKARTVTLLEQLEAQAKLAYDGELYWSACLILQAMQNIHVGSGLQEGDYDYSKAADLCIALEDMVMETTGLGKRFDCLTATSCPDCWK